MTHKRIEYSRHAVRRMGERGVRRSHVRSVLATGVPRPEMTIEGRDPRFSTRGLVGSRELEVVYIEDARRIIIITVVWRD